MTDIPSDRVPVPASAAQAPRSDRPSRRLAGLTRARLLAILRESHRAQSVSELAAELRLHPNSIREQLDLLVGAGHVERAVTPPRGRGRPAIRYRALRELGEAGPYRELARVLAEELARVPGAVAHAVAAGERWGRAAIQIHGDDGSRWDRVVTSEASTSGSTAADETAADETAAAAPAANLAASNAASSDMPGASPGPTERLLVLLDAGGFAPEPFAAGQPIRLRRCPFVPLAREREAIVCGVHLGLMRGALAELGSPLDAVRLEPFVEPDLCLAHLGPREQHAP